MDPRTTSVAEIMSNRVLTLRASTTLREAMAALAQHGISGAPVADDHGALIGVFSLTNVARAGNYFSNEEDRKRPEEESYVGSIDQETVRDWMTPALKAIPSTTSIEAAAKLMVKNAVHRLLVTHGGGIAGLVSAMDIVRWTAGYARAGQPELGVELEAAPEN